MDSHFALVLAVYLDTFSRAGADQTIDSNLGFETFEKVQAWDIVVCNWKLKICENLLMGTHFLNGQHSASRVPIDLRESEGGYNNIKLILKPFWHKSTQWSNKNDYQNF